MFTRFAVALTAAAVPALVAVGAGSASATTAQPHYPACDFSVHDILYGQSLSAFCFSGVGEFQVVAECAGGLNSWWVTGFPGIAHQRPSIAECDGSLLLGARVVDYHIEWL